MKRYLTIPLLAAALCLTACNLFPTLDPEPIVDPTEPMTVEALLKFISYEKDDVYGNDDGHDYLCQRNEL